MDDLKIRRKCEDMIAYGYVVLKQFPKAERHVLSQEIRTTMWALLRLIIICNRRYFKKTTMQDLDAELDLLRSRSFGVSYGRPARFDVTRLGPLLEEVHARLTRVTIECLSYDEFLGRYDRPGTLFYLDPPYWGNEKDYGIGMFGRDDFARLASILRALRGRFIMSINDVPEVRKLFGRFDIEPVSTVYTLSSKTAPKSVGELIITG